MGLMFTSWEAMSVDEPRIQGLVWLGQKIVQMVSGAPWNSSRQAQEGRKGGGDGGGRGSVVVVEGGGEHGMEAGGKAGQEAWWKLEG